MTELLLNGVLLLKTERLWERLCQSGCERGFPCDDNAEVCISNYEENGANCLCREGYIGKPCSKCLNIIDSKLGGRELILPDKRYTMMGVKIGIQAQGWRSDESARLPPIWPGFDFRTRRHMWVEFVVGSLLRISPRLKNQHFQIPIQSWNARTFLNEFLWTPWCSMNKQITLILHFFNSRFA